MIDLDYTRKVNEVCERCNDHCEIKIDGKWETCPDCCPHDEHDHGYCLDCGKNIMDNLIGRAEMLENRQNEIIFNEV